MSTRRWLTNSAQARRVIIWTMVLLSWEAAYRIVAWPAWRFPAPSHVIDATVSMMGGTSYFGEPFYKGWPGKPVDAATSNQPAMTFLHRPLIEANLVSGWRLLAGFAISVLVGAILGAIMWRWREMDQLLGPLFLGLQTLPSVCWVPLAILTYGLTEKGILFVLVMGSFSGVAISLRDGLKTIPPLYQRAGLMLGAKGWRMYRYVLLPASLPALAGSLRQGFSFAWRSLMGAEVIFAVRGHGLGWLLQTGRDFNDVAQVVAVMIVMVVIGMLVDRLAFAKIEERIAAVVWAFSLSGLLDFVERGFRSCMATTDGQDNRAQVACIFGAAMTPALDQLISDTIAITGSSAPPLLGDNAPILSSASISDDASDEPMYLIGLIGGKEVGKSSFVNALVGQDISEQTSHGPGTEVVIAYAHEAMIKPLRELLDREVPGRFKIYAHTIARLFRQVLVDLPDIDSIYSDHVQITRTMLRHMLFPIWVQSVEKYADQQPQKLLARVAEGNDSANFIFCLNKVDQLAAREGLAAIGQIREDYAARLQKLLKLPAVPEVFMVSAKSPSEYDFTPLRDTLSKQKTQQVVRDSQQLAGRQQTRTILDWLAAQNLPARSERLSRLREEAGESVAARLGVPILEGALPRLVNDPAYRLSIIDPVVSARMRHWPIVNVVHGLVSPLLAIVRRNISESTGGELNVNDYLNIEGQSTSSMVQTTFAQLHQSNPAVGALYRENKLWESMGSDAAGMELQRRLRDTLARQRDAALDRIGRRTGVVAPLFRWLLTVGAILWFPIVQPLLEISLQQNITTFSRALGLKIVELLGTTFLLKNLTFLLLWFAVLWAIVRARTMRRVSRLIAKWQSDPELDPSLSFTAQVMEWIDQLLDPIQQQQELIDSLVARIEQVRKETPARSAA